MKNKEIDKSIKKLFFYYEIYKIKIQCKSYSNTINDDIKKMEDYIFLIDQILNLFKKTEKEFIINVYINKLNHFDLPMSESNYYYKKRKFNDLLYKYISENTKIWLQLQL